MLNYIEQPDEKLFDAKIYQVYCIKIETRGT